MFYESQIKIINKCGNYLLSRFEIFFLITIKYKSFSFNLLKIN